jgi:hypothetical protein
MIEKETEGVGDVERLRVSLECDLDGGGSACLNSCDRCCVVPASS